jgi:hypothetical protein
MQFATPVWAVKQKEMGKANSTLWLMFQPFSKTFPLFSCGIHITKPDC